MRRRSGSTDEFAAIDPAAFRFVLVQPQSGGNVGSVARALKNLGFARLELVRPDCEPFGAEARMMAVEARDLLERAGLHDDLDQALDGARTVVGTSRRGGKHRRPHYRLDACDLAAWTRAGDSAFVFGREDSGLTDAELDRCTHLVHLPSSAAFPSFNLAQAVLLVAYELRLSQPLPTDRPLSDPPARHAEREAMYTQLQSALLRIGFLHRDTAAPIMRRLRRLLGRADTTGREVQLLRGLAHQIEWTAERAGLAPPAAAGPEDPDADRPGD